MPYYIYKTVSSAHILGISLIQIERGPGIRVTGLDPNKRNASGGATVVAMAQSGRQFSAADATGFGQCLAGNLGYATFYCKNDTDVVLRIILNDVDLPTLVKSAATHEAFNNMREAVDAPECTSMALIPAAQIEYSAVGDNQWAPLANFPNPAPKNWGDEW